MINFLGNLLFLVTPLTVAVIIVLFILLVRCVKSEKYKAETILSFSIVGVIASYIIAVCFHQEIIMIWIWTIWLFWESVF